MNCNPQKVIDVALSQVGYHEKASNSQLDDKYANSGSNNWNKYARDIDEKYPDWYNGKKNGYDWCDIFVDWCFITAYGRAEAQKLLCQPNNSLGAGCEYSYQYYRNKGQTGTIPKLGAQIFFGDLDHTGIVVDYDNSSVWTVEGNTGSGVNEVCKKQYSRSSSWIYGYGYPAFDQGQPTPTPSGDTWTGKYPWLPSRGYYLTGDGYEKYVNLKPEIKYIQEFLNWAINAGLEVDGCYGPATTKAVAEFQKVVGIEVDGSYGRDTLAAAKAFKKGSKPKPSNNVMASQEPEQYSASYSGSYLVNSTSGLNVRDGAGTEYKILVAIPYNKRVECYGYYTDAEGLRWLYIAFDYNGRKYIGFASSQWLTSTK